QPAHGDLDPRPALPVDREHRLLRDADRDRQSAGARQLPVFDLPFPDPEGVRVPRGLRPALTRRVVALGTLAALLASCNEPPAPPARPGVVLEIDGIVVEEHELEPLLDYIR